MLTIYTDYPGANLVYTGRTIRKLNIFEVQKKIYIRAKEKFRAPNDPKKYLLNA